MNKLNSKFGSLFDEAFDLSIQRNFYLGMGNPNAKILLIGKETSEAEVNSIEMASRNLKSWQEIISGESVLADNAHRVNALRPWEGQRFVIRKRLKNGNFRGEGGTSATWYNYQVLCDKILGLTSKTKDSIIDFYQYSFQSELSQVNLPTSQSLPSSDQERINSINARMELFCLPYFRQFKVTILAVGHYPKMFNFDIEKIFDVKWIGETCPVEGGNWYNIHYDDLERPTRIVIHTRQFSNGVSKELIEKISEECREILKCSVIC